MKRNEGVRQRAVLIVASVLLFCACERPASLSEALVGVRASIIGGPILVDRAMPCSGGGLLRLYLNASDETSSTGTRRLSVSGKVIPERCQWTTDQGPIVLAGTPGIVLNGSREVVGGVPANEIKGTLYGQVTWTLGGQTVTCPVNASYHIDLTRPLSPAISGKECERIIIKRFFLLD